METRWTVYPEIVSSILMCRANNMQYIQHIPLGLIIIMFVGAWWTTKK